MDPPPPPPASATPSSPAVTAASSKVSRSSATSATSSILSSPSSTEQHPHHRRHSSTQPRVFSAASFVGPLIAKSLPGPFKSRQAIPGPSGPKRKFGLLGCIFVILGCVLGSGIFAAPEAILKLTGNAGVTLLVWFVAGALALTAALCYVELGTTFPVSGGDYAYLKECFGNYPAFIFQISLNLIVTPVCGAILSSTAAKNLIIPNIPRDLFCSDGQPQWNVVLAIKLVAIMLIMLMGMINCKIPEFIEKIQGYLMLVNLAAILLMVTCGMVSIGMRGMPHDTHFRLALKPEVDAKGHVLLLVKALFQASFSYFGYTYANYMTEELERPLRNLPLGVGLSMPIIIGVNLLINFSYIATITLEDMGKTQTIADNMFRAVLPSSVAPYLAWFATTLVAFSVSGGLMSYILTCSRLPYAGARNGDFPPVFKLVDRTQGTPVPAIIYICILSSVFCMVGTIEELILIAAYLETCFNCLCIYGLIYVRFKRPLLLRPVKLPLVVHFTYALLATFLFLVPIVTVDEDNWRTSIPPVAGITSVLVAGTPLYFIFIRKTRSWPWLLGLNSSIMKGCQKMWLVTPEDILEYEDIDGEEVVTGANTPKISIETLDAPNSDSVVIKEAE